MISLLTSRKKLELRNPYEPSNPYVPQFGIIILSTKKDPEPSDGHIVLKANKIKGNLIFKDYWGPQFMKLLLDL